jgi:hypothetical protein
MLIEGYSKNEDAKKRTSKAKTEEKRNMKSEDKLTKKRKLNWHQMIDTIYQSYIIWRYEGDLAWKV